MSEEVIPNLEKRRERQALINCYHRVFNSEDGKRILEHLEGVFLPDKPAFTDADTIKAAIRDGQRRVFICIREMLKEKVEGDDNITKAKEIKS